MSIENKNSSKIQLSSRLDSSNVLPIITSDEIATAITVDLEGDPSGFTSLTDTLDLKVDEGTSDNYQFAIADNNGDVVLGIDNNDNVTIADGYIVVSQKEPSVGTPVKKIIKMTSEEYEALETTDPYTAYIITDTNKIY